MSSRAGNTATLVAAAFAAAAGGCVFDEASSLHRDSTVDIEVGRGNPSCAEAGYPDAVELAIDPAQTGTVTHETGLTVTLATDGTDFDFSASPGVDAVIAAGGGSATTYHYSPPALGDARLTAPDSAATDEPHALERITFCRLAIGCTLTAGYWKTRSEYDSARYDVTWAQLPAGADTGFFLSGQSYYEVLWSSPGGGDEGANLYYVLAHAYIAAELSRLAGAGGDVVGGALSDATEVFEAYTPDEVAALPASSELRAEIVALATLLDDYVTGELGPGSCEDLGID